MYIFNGTGREQHHLSNSDRVYTRFSRLTTSHFATKVLHLAMCPTQCPFIHIKGVVKQQYFHTSYLWLSLLLFKACRIVHSRKWIAIYCKITTKTYWFMQWTVNYPMEINHVNVRPLFAIEFELSFTCFSFWYKSSFISWRCNLYEF